MSVACRKDYAITIEGTPPPVGPTPDAWWPMEEAGSADRIDVVQGVPMALVGGGGGTLSQAAGRVAQAMALEVVSPAFPPLIVVRSADTALIRATGAAWTLTGWVYWEPDGMVDNPSSTLSWTLRDIAAGAPVGGFTLLSDPGNNSMLVNGVDNFPLFNQEENWHFFRIWLSGFQVQAQFDGGAILPCTDYFDAVLSNFGQMSLSLTYIGGATQAGVRWDEVALFRFALTDAQADFVYNAGAGRTYPY